MAGEPTDLLAEFAKMASFLASASERLSLAMSAFDGKYLSTSSTKSIEHLTTMLLAETGQKQRARLEQVSRRLLEEVQRDREGRNVDRAAVAGVCRVLRSTGFFESDFKKLLATHAEEQFKKLLADRLPIGDLQVYSAYLGKLMTEERSRCESLFADDSLAQSMLGLAKRVFVDGVIGEILNAGFERLVLEGLFTELRFFHDLWKDTDTFDTFLAFFEGFVKNRAEAILADEERTSAVERLSIFHSLLAKALRQVYSDDPRVRTTAERSLEAVVTKHDAAVARLLSAHVGCRLLRSAATRVETQQAIADAMDLFRFVQHKQAFIKHFNQQ